MTTSYQLRDAIASDAARLVELLLRMDAHVAGVPRKTLRPTEAGLREIKRRVRGLIDNPHVRLVVAVDRRNTIVAMGDLAVWHHPEYWENPERRGRVVGVIDDFWVEPRHRRRGLSRSIINELLEFAAERGVRELSLEYALTNEEAAGVWSQLGFQPTGVTATANLTEVLARLGEKTSKQNTENEV